MMLLYNIFNYLYIVLFWYLHYAQASVSLKNAEALE